jgi:hypothetical protein
MQSSCYFCAILNNLELLRQKFSIYNIKKILPIGIELVSCGLTDRQTDVTTLIVVFLYFAKANKNQNHENNDGTKELKPRKFSVIRTL